MSERLPWFRCFPSALLGALAGLDPDEGLTYVTALLRIYETGGPVAETGKTLSRRTGLPERKAAAALERLIEAGKLLRTAEGRLDSATTHEEIRWQTERRGDQSAAGKASAAKRQQQAVAEKNAASIKSDDQNGRQKAQQNQQTEATAVERPSNHLDLEREEEKKEEGADASASGSPAEPNMPLSPKDLLWRDGVLTLRGLGMTDPAARRFIGKLLRDTAGDSGRVHWAIDEARHAGSGDPIPLVTRILNNTSTNARASPSRFEGRDSAATILLKRDAEARRHEQSPDQSDFLDDRAGSGRSEPRGRSPRDAPPQRDRMGGTGQILDLVAVGSHRR